MVLIRSWRLQFIRFPVWVLFASSDFMRVFNYRSTITQVRRNWGALQHESRPSVLTIYVSFIPFFVFRLVVHCAYCATPLSLISFKSSKTFNYQPLFFHSPTQNENVKKVQSVFLPNWNWLFLLIFSLFKVEKINICDWSTAV